MNWYVLEITSSDEYEGSTCYLPISTSLSGEELLENITSRLQKCFKDYKEYWEEIEAGRESLKTNNPLPNPRSRPNYILLGNFYLYFYNFVQDDKNDKIETPKLMSLEEWAQQEGVFYSWEE